MLCKIHVPSAQSRFFGDHRAPAEEMKGWVSRFHGIEYRQDVALCQYGIHVEGFALYPFLLSLGGHRAIRKMCEPGLTVRYGRKIRGYGSAYPKNPEIGHTYA